MSKSSDLPPRERTSKPKKKRTWLRVLITVIILCLIGGGAFAASVLLKLNDNIDKKISNPNKDVEVPPEQSAKVKPLSILLLGVDTRSKGGGLNTDVIIVATLNPVTKTTTMVSIPRDTYIKVEGHKKRNIYKANSYYATFYTNALKDELDKGTKMDAAKEAALIKAQNDIKQFFGDYLNITIDYTAIIDFKGFVQVVDELGGVDVNVDQDMRYRDTADGTDINLKKGPQTLDGKNALDFVRYRHSNPGRKGATKESSDFERNIRQNQVLKEIVGKMQTLGGVTKIGDVIDAVGDNLKTDIPSQQIKDLIWTYIGISKDHIRYTPIEGVWKSPYMQVSDERLDAAKQSLQNELQGNSDALKAPETTDESKAK